MKTKNSTRLFFALTLIFSFAFSNNALASSPWYSYQPPARPIVTTTHFEKVNSTSVTVFGTISPINSNTSAWFEYGTTPDLYLGIKTNILSFGVATHIPFFSTQIENLSPGTTYYFRAVGKNSVDTVKGNILSFTTSDKITAPTTAIENPKPAPEKPKTQVKAPVQETKTSSVPWFWIIGGVLLIVVIAFIIAKRRGRHQKIRIPQK